MNGTTPVATRVPDPSTTRDVARALVAMRALDLEQIGSAELVPRAGEAPVAVVAAEPVTVADALP